jgi:hypothetical protein
MIVGTLVLSSATALAGNYGEYRDEFKNGGYSGSVGSLDWSNDSWKEVGDDGSSSSGAVHVDAEGDCVSSQCLHIFSEGDDLQGVGAKRHADTSVFSDFEICYEVRYEGYAETGAYLSVEKSVDGGSNWHLLHMFDLSEPFTAHPQRHIGQYDSMITRFVVHGDMVGEVFIDDVELKGELAETTTSTSSTTSTTIENSTTTTVEQSTTTTKHREETTTSTSTSSTTSTSVAQESTSTSTTIDDTTSTSEAIAVIPLNNPPGGSGGAPDGSGIRETARGIQASFDTNLFGEVPLFSSAYVDHDASYSMAAEVIKASWAWLLVLAVVMGWSIVSGLERKRRTSEA